MGILVCADPSLEKCKDYWVQDCSNATMNILTAVRALGLGAVWTGVYPREDRVEGFRALLDVPEGLAPFSFIVIGRPAEEQGRRDRYDPSRVHYNGWSRTGSDDGPRGGDPGRCRARKPAAEMQKGRSPRRGRP
jgi:hypothetical protein